jgi:hypothetical protein
LVNWLPEQPATAKIDLIFIPICNNCQNLPGDFAGITKQIAHEPFPLALLSINQGTCLTQCSGLKYAPVKKEKQQSAFD